MMFNGLLWPDTLLQGRLYWPVQLPPSREKPPIDGLRSRQNLIETDVISDHPAGAADDGLAYAWWSSAGTAATRRSFGAHVERVPRGNAGAFNHQGPNSARPALQNFVTDAARRGRDQH